jgi:DMSO/TMAO reductase YedYZ molybdopterin-dependent catalytic subunit
MNSTARATRWPPWADWIVETPGADLIVRRADPVNCEVRLSRLAEGGATPNDRFYIRNHFPVPKIDAELWRLRVHGHVKERLDISFRELRRMPTVTLPVTLECAGNGRTFFIPHIEGEPWVLGAVSTAVWKGIALSAILDYAEVRATAKHLIFRGADGFERSLSVNEVRQSPVLLAFEMNGDQLPVQHGRPLRAIAPSWYAVASVKWLTEIEVSDQPSGGYYQVERYVYDSQTPVGLMRVRSLIIDPEECAEVELGDLTIQGLAWSGAGPLARVEVAVGDGAWTEAEMLEQRARYAWTQWRLVIPIDRPGEVRLRSRATDSAGETQPEQATWNRLGYGNNSIQTVTVRASRCAPRATGLPPSFGAA